MSVCPEVIQEYQLVQVDMFPDWNRELGRVLFGTDAIAKPFFSVYPFLGASFSLFVIHH
jgi:hypothetical protein